MSGLSIRDARICSSYPSIKVTAAIGTRYLPLRDLLKLCEEAGATSLDLSCDGITITVRDKKLFYGKDYLLGFKRSCMPLGKSLNVLKYLISVGVSME